MESKNGRVGFWSLLLTGIADVWSAAAPSVQARADLLGLLLMVSSAAAFALMAAFAKFYLPTTPAQVIVLWRGLMMTAVFLALARRHGVAVIGERPWTLALRGL